MARAATKTPDDSLTRRERDVMLYVSCGASNREIAAALFVSEKTVEAHLTRILRKRSLRTRASLATWAAMENPSPNPFLSRTICFWQSYRGNRASFHPCFPARTRRWPGCAGHNHPCEHRFAPGHHPSFAHRDSLKPNCPGEKGLGEGTFARPGHISPPLDSLTHHLLR